MIGDTRLGSARAVNRRYISDWVPLRTRLKASAGFVSASALGMAVGPALAAVFEVDVKLLGLTFNANTLPGWFMAAAWLLYTIWLLIAFKEPKRMPVGAANTANNSTTSKPAAGSSTSSVNSARSSSLHNNSSIAQPLLADARDPSSDRYPSDDSPAPRVPDPAVQHGGGGGGGGSPLLAADADDPLDDLYDDGLSIDSDSSAMSDKPASSIGEAYSLLTTPVKVRSFTV
jgi:hypothetical protein